MPLESNEHDNDASDAGEREASEQKGEARPQVPPIAPPPNPPIAPPASGQPSQQPSNWRENTKTGLEIFGLVVLVAYTVFSCLQWMQIRWTNRLTREALSHSEETLGQTTDKMQGQIDATNRLYGKPKSKPQTLTRWRPTLASNLPLPGMPLTPPRARQILLGMLWL